MCMYEDWAWKRQSLVHPGQFCEVKEAEFDTVLTTLQSNQRDVHHIDPTIHQNYTNALLMCDIAAMVITQH